LREVDVEMRFRGACGESTAKRLAGFERALKLEEIDPAQRVVALLVEVWRVLIDLKQGRLDAVMMTIAEQPGGEVDVVELSAVRRRRARIDAVFRRQSLGDGRRHERRPRGDDEEGERPRRCGAPLPRGHAAA
jgi:hypothetical protein